MSVLDPLPRPLSEERDWPMLPAADPVTRLPILILNPHNRCNCRCAMCDIWRERRAVELSPEEVARWAADWLALGVRRVVLTGGEALMHRQVWELCAAIQAAIPDVGITLLTAGLLLRRHAADVVRCCDDVVVSLDGPAEVHDRIRGVPRAFERLADGVRAVRQVAEAAGARISVTGRCTVQRANFRHLRDTVRAARAMGLERVSFLAVDVSSAAFNRPAGWTAEQAPGLALTETDLPLLRAELDALERDCADDFARGFIAETPEKLRRRLLDHFAALLGLADFPARRCNAPWVSSVVEADGTVRPCFFQPPIGNVRVAGGLEAVLNSPRALAFRRSLDVATDPICRRCVCSLALRESTGGR